MVDSIFIGLSVITIGSAILSLESRELLYGGIALAVSMLGIAGYFIILDAPFVAMFQIAVYVGAVAVLVIFIVMLVRTEALFSDTEDRGRRIAGLIFSLLRMVLSLRRWIRSGVCRCMCWKCLSRRAPRQSR